MFTLLLYCTIYYIITLSIFYDITITHTLLHYYDTIQYLLHYYISYIIIHFLHSLILFFCYLVHLDLGNSHLLCLCHQNQGFCRYLCPGYLCPGIHHLVLATGKLSLLLDHHHSCFAYCRCYLVVFGYGWWSRRYIYTTYYTFIWIGLSTLFLEWLAIILTYLP